MNRFILPTKDTIHMYKEFNTNHQWIMDAEHNTFDCSQCGYNVHADPNVNGTEHHPLNRKIVIGSVTINMIDVDRAILVWGIRCN